MTNLNAYIIHYPYKGGSLCRVESDSEENALESFRRDFPHITPTKIESLGILKVPISRKSPAYISSDRLTWDSEGRLAWVFGFWAANVKFYADVPPRYEDIFNKKYRSIFGYDPAPKIGLYNISQDTQKWAIETEITFPITDHLPDDLERQQTARPGKIARIQLFWALMEHGFELIEIQNIERIRSYVPEQQCKFFDEGLKG